MINKIKNRLIAKIDPHINISYSQEGEDLILRRFFDAKRSGFFIDVGAHHPSRLSNTNLFYQLGWHGVNIDAMPGSMEIFNKKRPRDINIEAAISDTKMPLTYFMFNEPALNSFDKELSLSRSEDNSNDYFIKDKVKVETKTLYEILDGIDDKSKNNIDFLSVDVEGLDLQVLRSNDWFKYRPRLVLVEILNFENLANDEIAKFLFEKGYSFYAKSHYTVFLLIVRVNRIYSLIYE